MLLREASGVQPLACVRNPHNFPAQAIVAARVVSGPESIPRKDRPACGRPNGEAMSDWYVLQVQTGREENIRLQCERLLPPAYLRKVILPTYEESVKVEGVRRLRRRLLFPGYLILVTEQPQELLPDLHRVMGLTLLLGDRDYLIPISDQEVELIETLCRTDFCAELSQGIQEGNRVRVFRGPLMGLESQILRVDRHHRVCWLEMQLFGE